MRAETGRSDFWSRRRAAVEAEQQAEQAAEEEALHREEHAALEEKSDADILAELDLPEPEALQEGDDFSVFMAKAVPDRIRRRALRVLWRANPVLANLDELVEYGENYTDAATVVENLQTAYQVGRGMLQHVEKMAREAAAEAAEAEGQAAGNEPVDEVPSVTLTPDRPEEEPEQFLSEIKDEAEPEGEDDGAAVPAPRRMKFRLEETA